METAPVALKDVQRVRQYFNVIVFDGSLSARADGAGITAIESPIEQVYPKNDCHSDLHSTNPMVEDVRGGLHTPPEDMMAKKAAAAAEKPNKSQAIRDALAAHPDKSPKEIAEMLGEQGYQLNAQYVSTIKSNANRKAGGASMRVKRKLPGRAPRSSSGFASNGMSSVDSALQFIQSCGGLEQAKQVLATVEQIKAVL